MEIDRELLFWAAALILECVILYFGQRKIYPQLAARSKKAALVLVAPGTVLHEGAHYLMCIMLGIPVYKVELFRPREQEDGSIRLGVVEHGGGDSVRMTLVAIAPLLLVSPLLILIALLLLGWGALDDPLGHLRDSPIWAKIILLYLAISVASAAFPSPGDKVPAFGAFLLLAFVSLVFYLLPDKTAILQVATILLLPAAVSALLQLMALDFINLRSQRSYTQSSKEDSE